MTLLLYIACFPRYQLNRTQPVGEEDQDEGDGDVPAAITHPVGRRLLQMQVVQGGGQAEGEGGRAIEATPRRESYGLRAKRLLKRPDRLGN